MKTIKNLKAEELRKSILQLAIQGKLVKQDPNDEPASELVKRIYEEKNKLISEGKIKKEKNQSYIFKGDDNCYYEKIGSNAPIMLKELPFDIPDNWMFIKLESLTFPVGSKANQISSKSVLKKGQWPVVSQSQKIIDGYSNENEKVISIKSESPIIMFGDHTRNVKIIDFSFIIGADGTKFFKPLLIDEKYLFFLISYVAGNLKNRGYARHYSLLKQELLPLPPLNEQLRIVSKIKSFEPLIDKYDELEKKLTSLELEFPEKFKKSILQYAIEGKLVKQDPNDEPASVLLERIKTEKEKLIKEGKIKQDKNESYIYQGDDKNYYEKIDKKYVFCDTIIGFPIPSNWAFSKIGTISSYGYTILKREAKENDWLLELEDIECGSSKLIAKKFLAKNTNLKSKVSFEKGMILYSKLRPYLDKVLIANEDGVATSEIVPFYSFIDARYLVVFLKSPYFLQRVTNLMYGVKMPRLGTVDMNSTIIPVPPVKEQQHIVEKLELINRLI